MRVWLVLSILLTATAAFAQAPLVIDDASTTLQGKFHFEIFNQFATLPDSVLPADKQNTLVFTTNYGLLPNVELGADFPLITITSITNRTGIGDFDFTVKYVPINAVYPQKKTGIGFTASVEFPTGDSKKSFGSGVTDYDTNVLVEQHVTENAVLRFNAGIQFAGNTLTGLIGVRDRGEVISGGASATYQCSPKLAIAGEFSGYQGRSRSAGDREIRVQGGFTYSFNPHLGIAAAIQHGNYATPPMQIQTGLIIDP